LRYLPESAPCRVERWRVAGFEWCRRFHRPPYNSVRRVFLGTASRLVAQTGPSWTTPSYRAHQFASALRAHRCQRGTLRALPEHAAPWNTSTRTACAVLPRRPSLRSGLCCPEPSLLRAAESRSFVFIYIPALFLHFLRLLQPPPSLTRTTCCPLHLSV